jgi:hypothetical protein
MKELKSVANPSGWLVLQFTFKLGTSSVGARTFILSANVLGCFVCPITQLNFGTV